MIIFLLILQVTLTFQPKFSRNNQALPGLKTIDSISSNLKTIYSQVSISKLSAKF
ncbi:hypothetical protein KDA_44990 [Dictyobacter alpinus]|uniref:Uncharacterized protein n=1 Tax=Dictyobacter alpinus TaxID=2014873 RepID=A0A402BCD0_9CHLR|nr:hypothetical protein KDA_44990 [Dictyobacter alpinus]